MDDREIRMLCEDERRFRLIVNEIPLLVWTAKPDGHVDYYNDRWVSYTGLSLEDAGGQGWKEIIHPDDLTRVVDCWTATLASELDFEIECRIRRASDGEYRWHLWKAVPLRDGEGRLIKWMGSCTEIESQKRVEIATEHANQRYRMMVETVEDYALIMLDADGYVISWNAGAAKLKGYTADEIVGVHFSRFYTQDDIERGHPEEELLFARKWGRYTEEGWRVRKDGSRFLADVFITRVRDDGGSVIGFAKVVRDVTERNWAEERFKRVVEAAPNAMVLVGTLGLIELVNTQAERLFRYSRSEMVGQRIDLLLPSRFRANHHQHMSGFFAAASTRAMGSGRDLYARRKDGSEVPVEIGLSPIDTMQRQSVLVSVIDISERKRNEEQLRLRAEEMEAVNRKLESVNQELEEFAYVASHDLKAPLRVIDNASKWLEEDLGEHLTGDARESMNLMRNRIRRMEKLLDDLLEYARIGRVTDERYVETVSGEGLMADVLGLVNLGEFTVKTDPHMGEISVSRMPMQQILMNLVGNAIKHHDQRQGLIEVSVEESGDFHEFSVKDDGPGIAEQFHDQIFKMFQTLRPRDQVEGSGMGLALVRKHVELHGGRLWVESAPGEGSTFRFTWPKQIAALQGSRERDAA